MRVLVCPTAFKESLSAGQVTDAVIEGIRRTLPGADGVFYNLGYSVAWDELFQCQRLFEYCSQVNAESEKPVYIRLDVDTPYGLAKVHEQVSTPLFDSIPDTFRAIRRVEDARRAKGVCLPDVDATIDASGEIASILEGAMREGRTFLEHDAYRILAKAGVPTVKGIYLPREEAGRIDALDLDFPVVLKAIGDELFHKTEAGGVCLDLKNRNELSEALASMVGQVRLSSARGFLIQEMVARGTEIIVGGRRDPGFGPVVMVGLGGLFVEVFSDIRLSLAPVDRETARSMVEALKGYELLKGFRGSAPADVEALCGIVERVSVLMALFPAIDEIDLNPVKVLDQGQGAVVVDCKVFLARPGMSSRSPHGIDPGDRMRPGYP